MNPTTRMRSDGGTMTNATSPDGFGTAMSGVAEAVRLVTDAVKIDDGFGALKKIDVHATFKRKMR